ncbi:MAG TPA: heme-binding protein [Stellaceae bacterium]|nr:heme-binding protein [Stellaceae bacterium]
MAATLVAGGTTVVAASALAATCPVTHDQLAAALKESVKPSGGPSNGGLDTNEWASVVDRTGTVCAVAFSGAKADDQWPGSRAISAEKAFTANGLSLKTVALSTANLYAASQPGGSLYGMTLSNPVATQVIYAPPASADGTTQDPMVGHVAGGIIVFGGGLALYNGKDVVGGLGASGDTSCADHNIAWRIRQKLKLDKVPAGVGQNKNDGIIYDIGPNGKSASGWGHPLCGGSEQTVATQIGAGK